MCSNNTVNFQESTTILNARTKKSMGTYCIHLVYTDVVLGLHKHKNDWYYLPTPPLGQDMTQGQFLSGV